MPSPGAGVRCSGRNVNKFKTFLASAVLGWVTSCRPRTFAEAFGGDPEIQSLGPTDRATRCSGRKRNKDGRLRASTARVRILDQGAHRFRAMPIAERLSRIQPS